MEVKNGQCAPRFVSFCFMYGDVLSYPVDDAGVAMRGGFSSRAPFVRMAPREFDASQTLRASLLRFEMVWFQASSF